MAGSGPTLVGIGGFNSNAGVAIQGLNTLSNTLRTNKLDKQNRMNQLSKVYEDQGKLVDKQTIRNSLVNDGGDKGLESQQAVGKYYTDLLAHKENANVAFDKGLAELDKEYADIQSQEVTKYDAGGNPIVTRANKDYFEKQANFKAQYKDYTNNIDAQIGEANSKLQNGYNKDNSLLTSTVLAPADAEQRLANDMISKGIDPTIARNNAKTEMAPYYPKALSERDKERIKSHQSNLDILSKLSMTTQSGTKTGNSGGSKGSNSAGVGSYDTLKIIKTTDAFIKDLKFSNSMFSFGDDPAEARDTTNSAIAIARQYNISPEDVYAATRQLAKGQTGAWTQYDRKLGDVDNTVALAKDIATRRGAGTNGTFTNTTTREYSPEIQAQIKNELGKVDKILGGGKQTTSKEFTDKIFGTKTKPTYSKSIEDKLKDSKPKEGKPRYTSDNPVVQAYNKSGTGQLKELFDKNNNKFANDLNKIKDVDTKNKIVDYLGKHKNGEFGTKDNSKNVQKTLTGKDITDITKGTATEIVNDPKSTLTQRRAAYSKLDVEGKQAYYSKWRKDNPEGIFDKIGNKLFTARSPEEKFGAYMKKENKTVVTEATNRQSERGREVWKQAHPGLTTKVSNSATKVGELEKRLKSSNNPKTESALKRALKKEKANLFTLAKDSNYLNTSSDKEGPLTALDTALRKGKTNRLKTKYNVPSTYEYEDKKANIAQRQAREADYAQQNKMLSEVLGTVGTAKFLKEGGIKAIKDMTIAGRMKYLEKVNVKKEFVARIKAKVRTLAKKTQTSKIKKEMQELRDNLDILQQKVSAFG